MSAAPAMLGHCKAVYERMMAQAQTDGEGHKYFEGSGTRIVQEVGLSNPYYSSVFRELKAMDCIRQGRRGGGGMGSLWYLLQEPSEDLWSAKTDKGGTKDRPTKVNMTELLQASRSLQQQVARLDQRVAVLEARNV